MTINEYQKLSLRTVIPGVCDKIPNVALGLCGEAGEIADLVKKAEYQGHDLDKEHIAKELGDVAWYLALGATTIGYDLETILQMNVDKLKERYPEGFDPERSLNRKPEDV